MPRPPKKGADSMELQRSPCCMGFYFKPQALARLGDVSRALPQGLLLSDLEVVVRAAYARNSYDLE